MKSNITYHAVRLTKCSSKFAKRCNSWSGEKPAVGHLCSDYGNFSAWCPLSDAETLIRGRVLYAERGAKQSLNQIRKNAEAEGLKSGIDFDLEIVPINVTLEMAD